MMTNGKSDPQEFVYQKHWRSLRIPALHRNAGAGELIPDDRPPTRKQEQLIVKLVKDFLDSKRSTSARSIGQSPLRSTPLRSSR